MICLCKPHIVVVVAGWLFKGRLLLKGRRLMVSPHSEDWTLITAATDRPSPPLVSSSPSSNFKRVTCVRCTAWTGSIHFLLSGGGGGGA